MGIWAGKAFIMMTSYFAGLLNICSRYPTGVLCRSQFLTCCPPHTFLSTFIFNTNQPINLRGSVLARVIMPGRSQRSCSRDHSGHIKRLSKDTYFFLKLQPEITEKEKATSEASYWSQTKLILIDGVRLSCVIMQDDRRSSPCLKVTLSYAAIIPYHNLRGTCYDKSLSIMEGHWRKGLEGSRRGGRPDVTLRSGESPCEGWNDTEIHLLKLPLHIFKPMNLVIIIHISSPRVLWSYDSIIPFLNLWSGSVSECPAHTDGGGKNLKNMLHVVNAHFTT